MWGPALEGRITLALTCSRKVRQYFGFVTCLLKVISVRCSIVNQMEAESPTIGDTLFVPQGSFSFGLKKNYS